jgi:hypothetical protein
MMATPRAKLNSFFPVEAKSDAAVTAHGCPERAWIVLNRVSRTQQVAPPEHRGWSTVRGAPSDFRGNQTEPGRNRGRPPELVSNVLIPGGST